MPWPPVVTMIRVIMLITMMTMIRIIKMSAINENDDNDDNDDNRIPRAYAVEMALPLPTLSDTVPPQTERPSGGQ